MLGRYRLESPVGRGGMAEVWRAVDTKLGRTVALKVILANHASDRNFVDRFLREAKVVASLEHPHILPLYDVGEEGRLPFLVMPYLEGGTLRDRMQGGPVPLAAAAAWIAQLGGALDAAHEAGVLHRDVKPANVLLGKGDRLFLADFGIARMLESGSGLTTTGMVVGTPLYMAPEQAQGHPASPATDRYALAVIAYELLSGRLPFEGESPLSVMHQHVTAPAPALSTRIGGLPAGLDAVFATALAKDPAVRHRTCVEFAKAVALFVPTGISGAASPGPSLATAPTVLQTPRPPITTAPPPPPGSATGAPRSVATPAPSLTSDETLSTGQERKTRKLTRGVAAALVAAGALAGALLLVRGKEKAGETGGGVAKPAALSPIVTSEDSSKAKEEETAGASVAVQASPAPRGTTTTPVATATSPSPLADSSSKESPVSSLLPPEAERSRTGLLPALKLLDPSRRPDHRLSREDFESAAIAAREILRRHPEKVEARSVEIYASGGLEYVARKDGAASQALVEAFTYSKLMAHRDIGHIAFLLRGKGGAVVPPRGWELALAYGDARGEAEGLLDEALASRPNDVRALLGRAYLRRVQGRTSEFLADLEGAMKANPGPAARQRVLEMLRTACRNGLAEACAEAERLAASPAVQRRFPGAR